MGDLDKRYYLNLGRNGTFAPSGNTLIDTTAADVDKIFDLLKQTNQRRLFLYFHGGLVSAKRGLETATRIVSYAKLEASTYPYPICFVWETGLLETLTQRFSTIQNSKFFKKLLTKIVKVVGKKLGIDIDDSQIGSKGIGSMSEQEIRQELEQEAPFEKTFENPGKRSFSLKNIAPDNVDNDAFYDMVIDPEVRVELSEEIASDDELSELAENGISSEEANLMKSDLTDTSPDGQRGILSFVKLLNIAVRIAVAVIKRHVKERDHGFYPTIIEELFREVYVGDIGAWFWDGIKTKAEEAWKEDPFSGDPTTWHAGSYLLKKLKEYQNEVGPLSIDLLGHSAGSIAICQLLKAVNERTLGLKFRNIIFMAPACTCKLFSDTVLKFKSSFQRLRIFTMLDSYEQKDRLVPVLYPRSLLYFISGVLENESDVYLLGLQRHIIGNKPYDREEMLNEINKYLLLEDRIVYSVTKEGADEGFRSGAFRHGDFDNQGETTLDSIFYLLKQH